MSKNNLLCVILTAILVVTGCTGNFSVKKYDIPNDNSSNGIVYFLPKTAFQLDYIYKVAYKESLVGEDGRWHIDRSISCETPSDNISLTRVFIQDPNEGYEIDTSLTSSWTWYEAFSAALSEEGFLNTSSSSYNDQTISIINDVASTVLKAIPIIAAAGVKDVSDYGHLIDNYTAQLFEIKQVEDKLIHAELSSINKMTDKIDTTFKTIDNISKTIASTMASLDTQETYINNNIESIKKPFAKETTAYFNIRCKFEPDEIGQLDNDSYTKVATLNTKNCPALDNIHKLVAEISKDVNHDGCNGHIRSLDNVTIRSRGSVTIDSLDFKIKSTTGVPLPEIIGHVKKSKPLAEPGQKVNAYIYRIPHYFDYVVAKKDGYVFTSGGPIPINQYGQYGQIHINGKPLGKNTISVEFYPTTGGLKTYTANTTDNSSLKNISSAGSSIASQLLDVIKTMSIKTMSSDNTTKK
ncbi:MAG: hypothetical protein HQK96_20895 [Nitrospirae bacterium]|nr:hypothetical protein [Nitrospirota bacterium]